MSAAAAEMPPNPNRAATRDTTRKNSANLNMTDIHSCGTVSNIQKLMWRVRFDCSQMVASRMPDGLAGAMTGPATARRGGLRSDLPDRFALNSGTERAATIRVTDRRTVRARPLQHSLSGALATLDCLPVGAPARLSFIPTAKLVFLSDPLLSGVHPPASPAPPSSDKRRQHRRDGLQSDSAEQRNDCAAWVNRGWPSCLQCTEYRNRRTVPSGARRGA
jgi:hypothetical protein